MKIKRFLIYSILSLAILILAAVTFYFWASSSNHQQEEYSQTFTNNYPEKVGNDSVFSLITYNIGYLSGMTNNLPSSNTKSFFIDNLQRVQSEMKKLDADFVDLQEIDYHSKRSFYTNQQEELQKLGYNYVFQAVNWDVNYLPFPYFPISAHYGEIYSGQSILSKYPLFEPERNVLQRVESNPFYRDAFYIDRLAQVIKTIIDDDTVVLINVHLEAYNKATRIEQTKYITDLFKRYKDQYPVLLAGDFNSDLAYHDPTIKQIFNIPGFASAKLSNNENRNTFPSVNPRVRLDYIFYNTMFIEPLNSEILTSFGESSDHLPVLFEFKLK